LSYQYLSAIDVPLALLNGVCCVDYEYYKVQINTFYHNIVQALTLSAESSVPSCKQNFFKFWWDEQCQVLKDESISKHRVWVAAGRPREGPCAHDMRKARSEYKLYLKHKRNDERCCFTNDLHEDLADKDTVSFWKTWNAKFTKKFNNQVINGLDDHGSIADVFAQSFAEHAQ